MTIQELEQANELHKKIKALDSFLDTARKVWNAKVVIRRSKFLLKTASYGMYESVEYELDKETRDEILRLLDGRIQKMKHEMTNIGNEPKLSEGN